MTRRIDPLRRCLPVSEWPALDQALWRHITGPVSLLDENRSSASAWRPATAHKNRRGYGRWLNFLPHAGISLDALPADRDQPIGDAIRGNAAGSGTRSLYAIHSDCRVVERDARFAPERDWSWLKRKLNYLARLAEEAHETKAPPVLAPEIAANALRVLCSLAKLERRLKIHEAVTYRDWLMVSFLVLLPLRLGNFTALSIGKDLRKAGDTWEVRIPGRSTKTHRPIRAPLPTSLC